MINFHKIYANKVAKCSVNRLQIQSYIHARLKLGVCKKNIFTENCDIYGKNEISNKAIVPDRCLVIKFDNLENSQCHKSVTTKLLVDLQNPPTVIFGKVEKKLNFINYFFVLSLDSSIICFVKKNIF